MHAFKEIIFVSIYTVIDSRLNASLEGSILTWWLWWNQGSDPIHYSVAVYTSLADSEIFISSERTTDTTIDLDTLELKDGTYYLQVCTLL